MACTMEVVEAVTQTRMRALTTTTSDGVPSLSVCQPTALMDVDLSLPPMEVFHQVLPLIYLPTPWEFQPNQLIRHMLPQLLTLVTTTEWL